MLSTIIPDVVLLEELDDPHRKATNRCSPTAPSVTDLKADPQPVKRCGDPLAQKPPQRPQICPTGDPEARDGPQSGRKNA